jgi:hypothetical protein
VDEVRVNRAANNFATVFSELGSLVGELNDFSGADKGEVERIEEEKQPFALEAFEGELLELVGGADPGVGLEEGGDFADGGSKNLCGHRKIY